MTQYPTSIATIVGPYCPFPRDVYDDTCIHPPGCADVVAELHREHMRRLDSRNQKRRSHGITEPDTQASGSLPCPEVPQGYLPTEGLRGVGKHTNERRGVPRS